MATASAPNGRIAKGSAWLRMLVLAASMGSGTLPLAGCGQEVATPSAVAPARTATSAPAPAAPPTATSAPPTATAAPPARASAPPAAASPPISDVIKIGVDLPLAEPEGRAVANGAQLAIEQANAAGGVVVAGRTYRLVMDALDDGYSPDLGATNAQTLVADPAVLAVVGPFNSNVARGNMPVFNQAGLAQISPSNTATDLTEPRLGQLATLRPTGKLTYFRVIANDDSQGPVAADYLYDTLGARHVYILDDGDYYGQSWADLAAQRFQARGGTIVARDSLAPDSPDLAKVLARRAAAKPDAVLYGGSGPDSTGGVRKQMRDAGFTGPIFGNDTVISKQFLDDAGAAAEGTYGTVAALPLLTSPAAKQFSLLTSPTARQFQAAYQARFGGQGLEDSAYVPYAYDAANIIIAALQRAAAPDREAVRQQIAATKDFAGVVGTAGFDPNGDTTTRWIGIYQVKEGAWTPVDQVNYQGPLP